MSEVTELSDCSKLKRDAGADFGVQLLKRPFIGTPPLLLIRVLGGLSARMCGVISVHRLATQGGIGLHVNWSRRDSKNHHHRFDAVMGQLWCPKPGSFRLLTDEAYRSLPALHNSQAYLQGAFADGSLRPHIMFGLVHGLVGASCSERDDEFFEGYRAFFRKNYELHPALQQRVDEVALNDIENRIGIQLRCCGKKTGKEWNPGRKFGIFIKARLDADSSTRFFMSSDCPETANSLDQRFPGKIMHIQKKYHINTHPALLDTAVDFELLAKCREIRASAFSGIGVFLSMLVGKDVPCDPLWRPEEDV